MKNKLLIVLFVCCLSMSSCLTDNYFYGSFAILALDLVECQTTHLRPFTQSIQFSTTYIVEKEDGTPIPNASIQRDFKVHRCDGDTDQLSYGLVFTNLDGRYTETDNFFSNYTNDKIIINTELEGPVKLANKPFRRRAGDGGKTFTFIVHELED